MRNRSIANKQFPTNTIFLVEAVKRNELGPKNALLDCASAVIKVAFSKPNGEASEQEYTLLKMHDISGMYKIRAINSIVR
mmetsp:Transcript_15515/g.22110  ORF Transcript_15515/g.22110 Transcript_15515/m.22110 type:complete len:80 (-) Transcript_15515:1521-1760(-)